MPYARVLHGHYLPEFEAQAPDSWERRLREISPITDTTDHLRFRWREPSQSWLLPDRGVWEIYSCMPRALATRERASQFERHWSELPPSDQAGRRRYVTSYQHFMWHQHGVDARRFWVLQGEGGGTPAHFSHRESRLLEAEGWLAEPFPLGTFPPCPFDERSVLAILGRDRLVQLDMDLDALARSQRPDYLKALDKETEKEFRKKFLGWWMQQIRPQAEFLQSYLRKSESDMTMRRATKEEANLVTDWRDRYIETGTVNRAGNVSTTKTQVAIPGASV